VWKALSIWDMDTRESCLLSLRKQARLSNMAEYFLLMEVLAK
jgi:hypothetical protein